MPRRTMRSPPVMTSPSMDGFGFGDQTRVTIAPGWPCALAFSH
jgi:hypothetical protein